MDCVGSISARPIEIDMEAERTGRMWQRPARQKICVFENNYKWNRKKSDSVHLRRHSMCLLSTTRAKTVAVLRSLQLMEITDPFYVTGATY